MKGALNKCPSSWKVAFRLGWAVGFLAVAASAFAQDEEPEETGPIDPETGSYETEGGEGAAVEEPLPAFTPFTQPVSVKGIPHLRERTQCEALPARLADGESLTFYAFAYHISKYKRELRVSRVFEITYNVDSIPIHDKIALKLFEDFGDYLYGRTYNPVRRSPNGTLTQTASDYGVFRCMNQAFIEEKRQAMIDEFEGKEITEDIKTKVFQENAYQFKYEFNRYYKGSTTVTVNSF